MLKKIAAAAAVLCALSAPAAAMDCESTYNQALAAVAKMDSLTAGQRAARTRMALIAYDSCSIGDKDSAKKFFEMIMKSAG
jgi:hypothetical protein